MTQMHVHDLADLDPSDSTLLGGKGAGLGRMHRLGMPVPPAFVVDTVACRVYRESAGSLPDGLTDSVRAAVTRLESRTGKAFAGGEGLPLLVSVRSGAKVSMPGMMDTVLNLGLDRASVLRLAAATGNAAFAVDTWVRFWKLFAEIVLDAFPQETFKGKVLRISPVVSTKSRVLPVTVEVSNPANRIKAGIAGFVRIKSIKSSATSVPTVSVIKRQQKSMVICVENSRAKIREVRTGAVIKEGEIEVLDGVQPGEEIVVYGQKDVRENDVVNVDWLKWTHRDDVVAPAN